MAGVYLLGLGFGMHDPFNAIHMQGGRGLSPELLRSVAYFDDVLGHGFFLAGFMLVSLAVAAAEAATPWRSPVPWPWMSLLGVLGGLAGAVVWHNMVNERTAGDLAALLVTAGVAAAIQAGCRVGSLRRVPVLAMLYLAYGGGAAATIVTWCLRGVSP